MMMRVSPRKKRNALDVSNSASQDDFGAEGSIAGIAGDLSIGMSEILGANHSATGDGSLRKKPAVKSDLSYYEDDSVMLWSDDPEKQYFAYILQREQENRAKKGKSAEDSLIGDSTLEEIQQEFGKWYQTGGQEDSDQEQSFKYSLPPVSQKSNQPPRPNRPNLDGFSLATTEKSSRKENVKPDIPDTKLSSKDNSKVFPDVIYVTDTPATSVSLSKRSKDSSSRGGSGRMCFIFSLLLMGSTCLAAAGVGIYVSMNSNQGGSNSTVTSIQNSAGENNQESWTDSSLGPTPSQDPTGSDLLPGILPNPPKEPIVSPEILPTTEPTASPVTVPATPPRTESPSGSPTVTSDSPSNRPTTFPTSKPTLPTPSSIYCGCKNCEVALSRNADGFTCNERMRYLRYERGYSELGACRLVAGIEFPSICGLCNPDSCEPPIQAAEATTPRPSLRPAKAPNTQEALPLELQGNNGRPVGSFPLDECEGDCDNDDDCEEGLICFQRSAGEAVPGCLGGDQDSSMMDFCVLA